MGRIVNSQRWLSRQFDKLLPEKCRVDGNQDFLHSLVPKYLGQGLTLYDVGGGKNPFLSPQRKAALEARVIGIDINPDELGRAPAGSYDQVFVADIAEFQGSGEADLVICQAVLEHVRDVEGAFTGLASLLKPGGLALIFVPSRNALFARLNILLPEKAKKALLSALYPDSRKNRGFPAFYNSCTPAGFKDLAARNHLHPIEERYYFISSYFSFFFPAYLLWRLWVFVFHIFYREQAAETFSFVLRKGN
ncbi:MAG: class I SAM-dependent methyltransferase [Deltaproteobacteria bacterium]|nr:class I SAM-dependent methyltransferase [Deltaproteobacteria bacterium]